jgi:hypothetical protein
MKCVAFEFPAFPLTTTSGYGQQKMFIAFSISCVFEDTLPVCNFKQYSNINNKNDNQ